MGFYVFFFIRQSGLPINAAFAKKNKNEWFCKVEFKILCTYISGVICVIVAGGAEGGEQET